MAAFGGFLFIVAIIVIAGILIFIFHSIFHVYYFGFKGIAFEIVVALLVACGIAGFVVNGISNIGNTVKNTITGQTVSETIWDTYEGTGYYLKTEADQPCILMIEEQEGTEKKTLEVYFQTTVEADPNSGFAYYGYPEAGNEALELGDGVTVLTPGEENEVHVNHANDTVYSGDYMKVDLGTYYDTLYNQIYPANERYAASPEPDTTETNESKYVSIHGLDYTSFSGNYSSDQTADIPTYFSTITMKQVDEDHFSFALHMENTDTYYNTYTSYDLPPLEIPYSEIQNDRFTVSDGNVSFRVNLRDGNYIYIDNEEIIDNPDNWWFSGSYYPGTPDKSADIEATPELTWDGTYTCNNGGADGVKSLTITQIDDSSLSVSMGHTYGDGRIDSFSAIASIGTYNHGYNFASYEQDKTLYFELSQDESSGEVVVVVSQIGIYPDIDLEYDGRYIRQ